MKALMIADVFAGVGMRALITRLPELVAAHAPDLVIVNAENAADGTGTSARQAAELLEAGAHVLTGGNHSLKRSDFHAVLRDNPRVLRPANLAARAPGRGLAIIDTAAGPAAVINVMGSVFLDAAHGPFEIIDDLIAEARRATAMIFVDLHAEATSEKVALARYVDGQVTAVVGTHTHIQTADERVFPGGTAYITDLGMTGPHDSVIGVKTSIIVDRFLTGASARFEPADGEVLVQGVVITCDPATGHATAIERISLPG